MGIHSCELCPFKSSHLTNLKKHMTNHDANGKEDFKKCKFCDYYARYPSLIKAHEKLHKRSGDTFESLGGQKKACKLCPYKTVHSLLLIVYRIQISFQKNLILHSNMTKQSNNTNLARHILNHNYKENYTKCRYCDYYVSDSAQIAKHEIIHIDYSPNPNIHVCKKCPYRTNKGNTHKKSTALLLHN